MTSVVKASNKPLSVLIQKKYDSCVNASEEIIFGQKM